MEKPKIDFKTKNNPLIQNLSPYLKDPANFEDVQKKILATIMTTCSHSDLLEWSACKKCTQKMLERRRLMKRLGFVNPAQYMAWRKIHEHIKKKFPLVDWKKQKFMV